MAKPKKEKKVIEEVTCPEWMMVMGDAMSLLLTFFVLMLTFSSMNKDQLMVVLGLLPGALGATPQESVNKEATPYEPSKTKAENGSISGTGVNDKTSVENQEASAVVLRSAEFSRQYEELEDELRTLGFKEFVDLEQLDEGVSFTIGFDTIFKPGTAELLPGAEKVLGGFVDVVRNVGNEIRIIAFAGNNSNMATGVAKSWSIGIRRTLRIGEILETKFDINSSRLSYSLRYAPEDVADGHLELLLVEKLGVSEVTIDELLQTANNR